MPLTRSLTRSLSMNTVQLAAKDQRFWFEDAAVNPNAEATHVCARVALKDMNRLERLKGFVLFLTALPLRT